MPMKPKKPSDACIWWQSAFSMFPSIIWDLFSTIRPFPRRYASKKPSWISIRARRLPRAFAPWRSSSWPGRRQPPRKGGSNFFGNDSWNDRNPTRRNTLGANRLVCTRVRQRRREAAMSTIPSPYVRKEPRIDPDDKERLILEYAPTIKYIAQRIAARLPPHIGL